MSEIKPLMDSAEVAEHLKCSKRTVEDYARAGVLPAIKPGDGWMFPADALLRAVNRMAEEQAAKRAEPVQPKAVKVAPATKPGRPSLSDLRGMM